MTVIELLNKNKEQRNFSFEVLPPLKGTGTERLFATIEKMKEFNPLFINITTHHSEFVYKQLDNGLLQRNRVRRRLREIYRLNSPAMKAGFDIVVVARSRCVGARYAKMNAVFLEACGTLGLLKEDRA